MAAVSCNDFLHLILGLEKRVASLEHAIGAKTINVETINVFTRAQPATNSRAAKDTLRLSQEANCKLPVAQQIDAPPPPPPPPTVRLQPATPLLIESTNTLFDRMDQLMLKFWGFDRETAKHTPVTDTPVTVTWRFPRGPPDRFPKQSPHKWNGSTWGVRQMARIDFYRGKQSDDKTNVEWKEWAKRLRGTFVESRLIASQEDVSAQWMECIAGVSYHAANGGRVLFDLANGSTMEIQPQCQCTIAQEIWKLFERLGLGPRISPT